MEASDNTPSEEIDEDGNYTNIIALLANDGVNQRLKPAAYMVLVNKQHQFAASS